MKYVWIGLTLVVVALLAIGALKMFNAPNPLANSTPAATQDMAQETADASQPADEPTQQVDNAPAGPTIIVVTAIPTDGPTQTPWIVTATPLPPTETPWPTIQVYADTQVPAGENPTATSGTSGANATPGPTSTPDMGYTIIQSSTDGNWVVGVAPIRNTSEICDVAGPNYERSGCDAEIWTWLQGLYYGKPGTGILLVSSYQAASAFLLEQGYTGDALVRVFHAEECRIDKIHPGECKVSVGNLQYLLESSTHDGAFITTWDAIESQPLWSPQMTKIP